MDQERVVGRWCMHGCAWARIVRGLDGMPARLAIQRAGQLQHGLDWADSLRARLEDREGW